MKDFTIAVTGSSGFVGRHLVSWLVSRGLRTIAVSRSSDSLLPGGALLRSLRDYSAVSVIADAFQGAHAVVHLAARAHVMRSGPRHAEIAAYQRANIDGALLCADAALQAGCRRFVLVSTIGVNGNSTNGRPFTEDDAPSPREPYSYTKWQAERAVSMRLAGSNMELVIVRPPLVYGQGCHGNFRALINLVKLLPVLPFGAIGSLRSYIGIENLCSALEMAALHPDCANSQFVLSDGEDICLASLVRQLADCMGRMHVPLFNVPPVLLKTLATLAGRGDAYKKLSGELRVDSQKFRRCTGWEPPVSLELGLRRTITTAGQ